jgi:hypothetical protein
LAAGASELRASSPPANVVWFRNFTSRSARIPQAAIVHRSRADELEPKRYACLGAGSSSTADLGDRAPPHVAHDQFQGGIGNISPGSDIAIRASGAEAYPLDADQTPSASGTGYASIFALAGFKTVARRVLPRPIGVARCG